MAIIIAEGTSFAPKGQRIPAQGETLGMPRPNIPAF
jgi:hypothetical protein